MWKKHRVKGTCYNLIILFDLLLCVACFFVIGNIYIAGNVLLIKPSPYNFDFCGTAFGIGGKLVFSFNI